MRATWNGTVIAESDQTVVVEGNHYFPAESVNWALLKRIHQEHHLPLEGPGALLVPRRRRAHR